LWLDNPGFARILITAALIVATAIGESSWFSGGDVVYALPAGWKVNKTNGEQVQVMPSDSGGLLVVYLKIPWRNGDPPRH
jgi:hypothetical protein